MSAAVRCVIPLQTVSPGQSPSSCCCCDDRSNPDVYRSGQDGERTDFIPNSSASGSRRTHGPDRQRPASKTFIPRKPLYNNCWTTPRCYTNTIMSEQHGTAPSSRTANVRLGARSTVSEFATLGYEYVDDAGETVLGADATVRSGSIVYAGCGRAMASPRGTTCLSGSTPKPAATTCSSARTPSWTVKRQWGHT